MTLSKAHNLIVRQITVFEERRTQAGQHVVDITLATKLKHFKGVELHSGRKRNTKIDADKFYMALADNLQTILLMSQSLHAAKNKQRADHLAVGYREVIEDLKILSLDPRKTARDITYLFFFY